MKRAEISQSSKLRIPKFKTEDEEANWWASADGREFVKQKSATGSTRKQKGSSLVPA